MFPDATGQKFHRVESVMCGPEPIDLAGHDQ
jgi:hypothetical protein